MSDRSVTVRIGANVSGFIASIKAAERSAADLGKTVADKAGRKELPTLGMAAAGAGLAISAGVGVAVKSFMDFDKAMSGVKAVSSATTGEMDKLRSAALKAGADTAFSATDAAKAEAELAKVGISTSDILGGALTGSLNLAAAGQLDLGEAATISGQAMKIFGLQGKDVGHIADVLAAGANKSAADVRQLGDALRQGGLASAQAGENLDDTVGVLSLFADNALIGSDAGTSLKTMLISLANPSKQASQAMQTLGISAYDSTGKFVGFQQLAGQLQTKLGGLTQQQRNQALATIFGSDAMRAAGILFKAGSGGVQEYTKAVNDQGAAARMAGTQMDNLAGDVEQLKGSLETALIKGGSAANGALRGMTQAATATVNAYGNLPGPIQKTVTVLSGVSGAALLAVGGLATLAPKVRAAKVELEALGISSVRTSAALSAVGRISVAATALLAVGAAANFAGEKLYDLIKGGPAQFDKLSNSLVNFATTGKASGEATRIFGKDFKDLGNELDRIVSPSWDDRMTDVLSRIGTVGFSTGLDAREATNDFKALDQSLAGLVQAGHADVAKQLFGELAAKANESGKSTGQLTSVLPAYQGALASAGAQSQLAAGGTKKLGAAAAGTAASVQSETDAIKALVDQIDLATGGTLAMRAADRQYQEAIDAATKSVKDNGHHLDIHTEKGRANQAALDAIATAANDVSKQLIENGAAQRTVAQRALVARDAFVKSAVAMGMARDDARRLAAAVIAVPKAAGPRITTPGMDVALDKTRSLGRRIGEIPTSRATRISTPGIDPALNKTLSLGRRIGEIPSSKTVTITTVSLTRAAHGGATGGMWTGQGFRRGYDTGGLVDGPGTATSDSIPAPWLSRGEFVEPTSAVGYYGVGFMEAVRTRRYPKPDGYAAGGYTAAPRYVTAASTTSGASGGGNHFHFHNSGPIGSRVELENWVRKSLDNLWKQGRLRQRP